MQIQLVQQSGSVASHKACADTTSLAVRVSGVFETFTSRTGRRTAELVPEIAWITSELESPEDSSNPFSDLDKNDEGCRLAMADYVHSLHEYTRYGWGHKKLMCM